MARTGSQAKSGRAEIGLAAVVAITIGGVEVFAIAALARRRVTMTSA